ncbi:TonB-dependent receptor [Sphingomonas sp. VNH70]|uniref:TonB-dependent receptor n=1 Tax=Sphingomonas silueang TaxID=3156617 RepID=UPI0032B5A0A1
MKRGGIALAGLVTLVTAVPASARDVPEAEARPERETASEGETAPEEELEILVTARNRTERVDDVPIPISVVGAATIAQQRVFTLADLTQRSPGLTATTPNARRTGVSLRGIGKTSGNDNMEAAVGVIVDDVFLGHVGMTYQDFTDLERIEILRGPQGTLLGKNTSLGVIKYTSKAPSFARQATLDLETGLSHEAVKARASYSDAVIDDVLAIRASGFIDRQSGDILNVSTGERWHERNRWGGRVQLLFTPGDRFSVRINADAAETNENSNTKPFMVDPVTLNDGSVRGTTYTTRLARAYFGGYKPIIGSWNTIDMDMAEPLVTRNRGISAIATWDAGPVTITSISAVRKFGFDAKNDSEQTRFAIARGGTLVDTDQWSQEFRFAGQALPRLSYQAGLYFFGIETRSTSRNLYGADAGAFYATNAQYAALRNGAGVAALRASLADVFQTTYQNPVSDSQAAFAQVDWAATDRLSLTLGLRYTREQKANSIARSSSFADGSALVSTGNATADAIRAAQLGASYATIVGDPIRDDAIAWLVNPSVRLNDDVLLYASASSGEKSGAVAFENNGTRRNVAPEKALDFELGFKGRWFDRRLTLNANLYYTRVRDYQNVTSEVDPASATGYSSRLGNIPGIDARGVEAEGVVDVGGGLSINVGGAWNVATYGDWSTATCPRSFPTTQGVCDNSGRQIVGAPRWTALAGFQFARELAAGFGITAFANDSYRSAHNLEQLLSEYGYQRAYHLTDVGIGVFRRAGAGRIELSLVAKNLFDVHYTTSVNDFSNTAPVGYDGIGARRYVGLLLRSHF